MKWKTEKGRGILKMKIKTEMKKGYCIVKRIKKDLLKLEELDCIGKEDKKYQGILNWVTRKINFYSIVAESKKKGF